MSKADSISSVINLLHHLNVINLENCRWFWDPDAFDGHGGAFVVVYK
jgi:hypothetical protein